jgi:anti-anti-sigma factor
MIELGQLQMPSMDLNDGASQSQTNGSNIGKFKLATQRSSIRLGSKVAIAWKGRLMTDENSDRTEPILKVYETGKLTVVGFGGRELLDQVDIGDCRQEIEELVKQNGCETLAFDMTGVKLIPSGLLGLLASIREDKIEVQIYNPSRDVREVLEITKLDQVISIHDVDVNS